MPSARWLWAIVLTAAALRIFPVWFGLPYLRARPDEAVSISRASGILAGDFNPHFFHWPSLTFYVFAAALGTVSAIRSLAEVDSSLPVSVALITARTIVAIAGTLTVIPLFQLGRRMAGQTAGLLAAAFLAVVPLHVRDSHFAMTDVLMTLLFTMCLAALVAAYDMARGVTPGRRIGSLPSPDSWADWPRPRNTTRVWSSCRWQRHKLPLGRGWYAHATRSLPYGCGALLLVVALAGLVIAPRRHPRHTFIVAAFGVAYYAVIGSGYTVFFRYVMPLVPIVCLFAAVATKAAGDLLPSPNLGAADISRRSVARTLVTAALVLFIAGPPALTSVRIDLGLARTDTRVIAAEWLGPQLHPEHTLHDTGGDYTRLDLRDRRYHEWRFDPKTRSFGHPDGLTPDWIVIADSPVRHYTWADPRLRRLVADPYDLVYTVNGTTNLPARGMYDQQDQ